jgi:hypothetical protein
MHAWSMNQRVQKAWGSDRRPVLSLYFLHAQHRVQKAKGSQLASHSILVLFIREVLQAPDLYTYIHHLGIQQRHFHTYL